MSKKDIKPGTICTLTKNHSIVFKLSRIDDNGWPYTKMLVHGDKRTWQSVYGDDEGCVTYCDLFEEATPEQKRLFEEVSSRPFESDEEDEEEVDTRVPRKMYFESQTDLHEKMKKYGIKNEDILSFVSNSINGDAVWVLFDRLRPLW